MTERISLKEIAYLSYFAVMLAPRAFGIIEGNRIYNLFLIGGVLLFGITMLLDEYSRFEISWMLMLLVLGAVVYMSSGEKGFLMYLTMALGVKGVSDTKIFRCGAWVYGTALTLLTILSLTNILNEPYAVHYKYSLLYIGRHTFGYSHPNILAIAYLVFTTFVILLADEQNMRSVAIVSALLMAGNLYVFLYSVSVTGMLATTLLLILNIVLCRKKAMQKQLDRMEIFIFQAILPACLCFILILPVILQGSPLFLMIDNVINSRFRLANEYLTSYKPSLFGYSMWIEADTGHSTDSAYLYAWIHLGVFASVFLFMSTFLMTKEMIAKQRYKELAVLITYTIAGTAEQFLYNISYLNICFVFLGVFLFEKSTEIEKWLPEFWRVKVRFLSEVGSRRILDYAAELIKRIKRIITSALRKEWKKAALLCMVVAPRLHDLALVSYSSPQGAL